MHFALIIEDILHRFQNLC